MEPIETVRKRGPGQYSYQKAVDNRKQPVRGLWKRNGRFLARLKVEDAAGRKVQTSVKPAKVVEKMWKFNSLKRSEKRDRVEDRLEEFLAGSSAEG